MNVILTTPRLILRQMTEADAPNIFQLNSDPEVTKYVHEAPTTTHEHALKIITDIIIPQYKNGLGRWAMIQKSDNSFIGWCGVKYRADDDEYDLGYRIMRSAWGKGYATEAAGHCLAYGLDVLNLKLIQARAHFENLASLNVLQKIGMKYVRDEEQDGVTVRVFEAF